MNCTPKRLREIETTLGQQAAINANRITPDVYSSRPNQYGSAHSNPTTQNPRRKNLVFEGLQATSDRDTIAFIIEMCTSIGVVAYQSDFEDVVVMRRKDGSSKPPPILVTFEQQHVRTAILRNNYKRYSTIFVNADEPMEVRRAKAVFRRVGYLAKQDGKTVQIRDDWIRIDDDQFKMADIDKIPEKYRTNLNLTSQMPARPSIVKIKMTTAGLTFSGPSAYLSHMHRVPFVYKKTPYSSVEQGYHHLHAVFEQEPTIAAKILDEHEPLAIKDIASALPKSEAWNKVAPGHMWDLNEAKFEQNPCLKKQLIETAPTLLIEASFDKKWGEALPFGNDI